MKASDDSLLVCLPFPLYHGTSTLWKESILHHGLGGRNVIRDFRALEFYRTGAETLRDLPEDLYNDLVNPLVMSHICAQDVTAARFNFRHGGEVYLTPSRMAARRYAGDFGSELIRECRNIYTAILRVENGLRPSWLQDYSELISKFANPGEPLLIRIDDVRFDELTAEDGNDARIQTQRLLDTIAENRREAEHRDSLRRAARAGDAQAMVEFWNGSDPLTIEQVVEALGQQVNFQAKIAFPACRLRFE